MPLFCNRIKAHRLGMLVVFVVITLATTALLMLFQAPEYEAKSSILIRQGKWQGSGGMKSEIAVLQGNALAEQVLANIQLFPEVAEGQVQQFQQRLEAHPVKGTRIVEIVFRHSNPELAVQTVNTLIRLFMLELEKLNAPQLALMEEELLLRRKQMQQTQNVLSMFRQNDRLQGNDWQIQYLEIKSGKLEAVLEEETKKEEELTTELAELRRQFAALPVADVATKDAFLQMKLYRQELLRKYDAKEPLITAVDNQLAQLRRQLNMNKSLEKVADQIVLASAAHATQQEERDAAQRELNQIAENLRQEAEQKKNFSSLEAEVEKSRELYAQQLNKVEESRKMNVRDGYITIIEQPQLPLETVRPKKLRSLAAAMILGLIVSLLYDVLQQWRKCPVGKERG